MSIYTETPKAKSLWHPITDDDFDIDFNVPFVLFTDDASLIFIDGIGDMLDYIDDEGYIDCNMKSLTEKGKDLFRSWYVAFMYVDEDFFEAIHPFAFQTLEEVKGKKSRAEIFVMFEDGEMTFLDHFDFEMNGGLLTYNSVNRKMRGFCSPVKYFVNINHLTVTSLFPLCADCDK